MRIALFGGTFNPIHFGHLRMAEAAREAFHLDKVIFLPTAIPPHKAPAAASPYHRRAMIQKAIAGHPHFSLSDWELRQKRVVYTIETLAHFKRVWKGHRLFFLIGSDSLRDIDSWRGGQRLLKECPFLVMERPGAEWNKISPALRRRVRLIPMPAVPDASREIRRRVSARRSIHYQVPAAVEKYIKVHRLYV